MFLYSLGFGFVMGLLYDTLRLLRRLFFGKRLIALQDITFFLSAGVLTFLFLLVYDFGRVRMYTLCAMFIGFLVFYFSFAGLILGCADKFVDFLRRMAAFFMRPFKAVASFAGKKTVKTTRSMKKNLIKGKNKMKMLLKIYKE